MPISKRLSRSKNNKILFGVCGGLAEYFSVDPKTVRGIFVYLAFFNGIGILIYFVILIYLLLRGSPNTSFVLNQSNSKNTLSSIVSYHQNNSKISEKNWQNILLENNKIDLKNLNKWILLGVVLFLLPGIIKNIGQNNWFILAVIILAAIAIFQYHKFKTSDHTYSKKSSSVTLQKNTTHLAATLGPQVEGYSWGQVVLLFFFTGIVIFLLARNISPFKEQILSWENQIKTLMFWK